MASFDQKLLMLTNEAKRLGIYIDEELLSRIAKSLGPALYHPDAALVASTDVLEINRIKDHFIKGKLGISDEVEIESAISEAIAQLGFGNRNKYRALFYYLLVVKFGKASLFKD